MVGFGQSAHSYNVAPTSAVLGTLSLSLDAIASTAPSHGFSGRQGLARERRYVTHNFVSGSTLWLRLDFGTEVLQDLQPVFAVAEASWIARNFGSRFAVQVATWLAPAVQRFGSDSTLCPTRLKVDSKRRVPLKSFACQHFYVVVPGDFETCDSLICQSSSRVSSLKE